MGKKPKNKKPKKSESKDSFSVEASSKKLSDQNLDEFLDNWDNDSEGEEGDDKNVIEDSSVNDEEAEKPKASKKSTGAKTQKNYLASLNEKDPEFLEFLKENDQELLQFDESSDEDEEPDKEESLVHKVPDTLEVASDESDFEEEDGEDSSHNFNSKKLKPGQVDAWVEAVQKEPNLTLLQDIVEAFRAAVASIASGAVTGKEGDQEATRPSKYVLEGGVMFNSVVRLCITHIQPALRKFLKLDADSTLKPEKCKKWKKIEKTLRVYLLELVTLLGRLAEQSVLSVLLKHIHSMLPFYLAFQKGAKQLMGKLISIWSCSSETPRILAFMCLVKLVRNSSGLLEPAVKAMYLAYVKNCKFTSPSSLPAISFMKRSLVEMLGLDHNLAYYQAFVYIRQLAIHLRNAVTTAAKDSLLAVYNWQFVHSLELWAALVGHSSAASPALQPLIYPLVQVVIGTANLVSTPKFFPLRFHCANILKDISASTGTFIPVLPFYLDVLNIYNFGKKSKKVSMKPLDFSCVLKLSKSQMLENGFKDATIEEIYSGMLSYLSDNSNKIGFPELVTPMIFQLKDFLKKCKVPNYNKKFKSLLDKTVANQKFIETRRKNVNFGVGDGQEISAWEAGAAAAGTPLSAHYTSWKKTAEIQQAKRVSEQEKLDDYSHIPQLKKNHKKIRMKTDQVEETSGFLSGSDDDFDEEENFKPKEERGKKRKSEDINEDNYDHGEVGNEEIKTKKKDPKKAKKSVVAEENKEEEDDEIEDLKLEDLDSDSELELDDEFDVSPNATADASESDESDDDGGD